MTKTRLKASFTELVRMGLVPIAIYLAIFLLLTYPEILLFSNEFLTGKGDGLLGVWNIWWVNKAVTELVQSPWYTSYLHYPYGTTLLGHDLTPFNGLLGILLLPFLTLIETHNFLVIFSFVIGGVTAFWLAYYFTKSFWASIIAGGIFTFSPYHFAHAHGHLSLTSIEWIPLFLLSWYLLLTKPRPTFGILSGAMLFLVLLSNYYYFLSSLLAATLVFLWQIVVRRDSFFWTGREHRVPLTCFFILTAVTTGPLVISFLISNIQDPFLGGHDPQIHSLDALALFIPGGYWRFADLTKPYWSQLPGFRNENSVHIGISLFLLIIYTWFKRRDFLGRGLEVWFLLLIFFTVIALGPSLRIWGRAVDSPPLPYALLEMVFPPLKVSGVPVRMVVMTLLSASVISAVGLASLFRGGKSRWLAILLILILTIEYLPSPLSHHLLPTPGYVYLLKDLPGGGVLDMLNPTGAKSYYQTIYEKPMAFGRLSRLPQSVRQQDLALRQVIADQDYQQLFCEYGIRYLTAENTSDLEYAHPDINLLYADDQVKLYDLGAKTRCD